MNKTKVGGNEPHYNADNTEEISIADIVSKAFRYRGWYIISVAVMLVFGVLYIKSTPKVYTRMATVLFKDGGSSVLGQAAFADMFSGNSNSVYNDIGLFRSRRLMLSVVDRLGLQTMYSTRSGLMLVDLYRTSPFEIEFNDVVAVQYIAFRAKIVSETELLLTDLQVDRDVYPESFKVAMGQSIELPFGTIVVSPTLFMNPEYVGRVVNVGYYDAMQIAQMYNDRLSITMVDRMATLVNLEINDVSIVRAEDLLNTLIEVYKDDAVLDKSMILLNTASFIDDRLAIIDDELTAIDAEIESFKRDNKLTDIVSESSMYVSKFNQLDNEVLQLDNQLTMARYMKSYLEDNSKLSDLIPANIGITDGGVQSQIGEYNTLMTKRNKLLVNSSAQNPLVIDLQTALVSMRSSIIRSIDNLIAGLEIQERNFSKKEHENSLNIADVPSQQKYLVNIMRQQKIKEELYLYLLNKQEECALQQSVIESNCRIVDSAFGQLRPISPRKSMVALMCLVLGFLIPSAIIYIISLFNTKVRTRKDLKEVLTVPYLGDIPNEKREKGSADSDIVIKEGSRTPVNEAFRILRDNIDYMNIDNKISGGRVLQLTSFNPGSGKSFVTLNLATSIALGGLKVIVIDLDIRKGTLSKRLGIGLLKSGVSQYLSGKVDSIDESIHKIKTGIKFDVMSSGSLPPNPAELLKGDRMAQLISELKSRYDYILIDNPPFSLVVDAAICARHCDQSIYVVRAGVLDRKVLPDIQDLYENNKLPNMSILLNGTDSKSADIGYGYGYGYGYAMMVEKKKFSLLRAIFGFK